MSSVLTVRQQEKESEQALNLLRKIVKIAKEDGLIGIIWIAEKKDNEEHDWRNRLSYTKHLLFLTKDGLYRSKSRIIGQHGGDHGWGYGGLCKEHREISERLVSDLGLPGVMDFFGLFNEREYLNSLLQQMTR